MDVSLHSYSSSPPTQPLVAAVKLDGSDNEVLSTALHLARRLNARLELVHAVRPIFSYVSAGDMILNPYYGHEMTYADTEEREARIRLSQIIDSLDDARVTGHIIRDFPAEGVMALAHECAAALIICGVRGQAGMKAGSDTRPKTFLSGLTTGFALAAEAEVPVLLVPPGARMNPEGLKVLVADSGRGEGEEALRAGVHLANALDAEQLTHMHVQETSLQEIDRMIESVRASILHGHESSTPVVSRELYMERVRAQTREELQNRCTSAGVEALNRTRYETVVSFGNPADEVHAEVLRSDSHLMVFGRHHLIRKKSLSLGRIPYHAMIENGVLTLIVPDAHQEASSSHSVRSSYFPYAAPRRGTVQDNPTSYKGEAL